MQNCIGAIDGTHIPITINEDKAPPFRNRKGTLSQNVMFACDFDLKFTSSLVGGKDLRLMQESYVLLLRRGFMYRQGNSTL